MVTSAASLIEALVKKNPEEYKGCVSLAVSRLSRVRILVDQDGRPSPPLPLSCVSEKYNTKHKLLGAFELTFE